jgi:hypothetical protein
MTTKRPVIERDEKRERFVREQSIRYGIAIANNMSAYRARCDTRSYSVIMSRDRIDADGIPDFRWHISVAGESSVPRWADFVAIVHELRPGVMFCVPMPPPQFWLNVNPNTLHVWEIKDEALTSQWRDEGLATRAGQRSGRFPGSPEAS